MATYLDVIKNLIDQDIDEMSDTVKEYGETEYNRGFYYGLFIGLGVTALCIMLFIIVLMDINSETSHILQLMRDGQTN